MRREGGNKAGMKRGEGLVNVVVRSEGMGFSLKSGRNHLEWFLSVCICASLC